MQNDWFQKEKHTFFKKERKDLLKGTPKKDESKRGYSIIKQKKFGQGKDFSPISALKVVGGLAVLGVGIHLASEIID